MAEVMMGGLIRTSPLVSPLALVLGAAAACGSLLAAQPPYVIVTAGLAAYAVVALVLAGTRESRRGRSAEAGPASEHEAAGRGGPRLLDTIPGMVWQADARSQRVFVNRRWLAITGLSEEQALGEGWLDAVHPIDRDLCHSAHRLACTSREPFDLEYRLRCADGGYRLVLDQVEPRFGDTGVFHGFVGLTIDVGTAGKHGNEAHTQLHQLNESINRRAHELVDRFEKLEDALELAQYSSHVCREFLVALSDELRPAVDEIRNAIGLLLPGGELSEMQRTHLERVQGVTDRLCRLTDRADHLGGFDAENDIVQIGHFNLRRLIERVVRSEQLAMDGGTIACTINDVVPTRIKSDPIRLRSVLAELLAAARAHGGDEQAIKVNVTSASREPTQATVSVTISFDAQGLTDEQLDRAFYPVEPVGQEPAGLGLGGCRKTAALLEGEVGLQREDDGRVTFWCRVGVEDLQPHWAGRRVHSRLALELVSSSLGPVLDLSSGGMRVRSRKGLAGQFDVELRDDEETLAVRAEVAWCRRIGFGKHEVGLRFLGLTPELTAQLGRLATRNRLRQVVEAA